MANVTLEHIKKVYENGFVAVHDFNLNIQDKEFVVFVGPSGCGKSTTLRMIAGLEDISEGKLLIDGVLSNDRTPKDRDIAMVFQSYALYPHMSVYDNMAFGLQVRKLPKAEINQRVTQTARLLEIEDLLKRKPKQLSGGQRQRVALGRAIVRNAKVYLMDEPLSNLDAKLRVQMRSEIISLHERLQATIIYVTHDQTEAMTMADRIVVMKDGWIMQTGTPKEIYQHPQNMFVAGFMGSPSMNFIHGTVRAGRFVSGTWSLALPDMYLPALKAYEQQEVVLGIRPEDFHMEEIVAETFPEAKVTLTADFVELLGNEYILHGKLADHDLVVRVPVRTAVRPHEPVELAVDASKLHFFDPTSEKVIG